MVKSLTIKGFEYTAGLTRDDLHKNISREFEQVKRKSAEKKEKLFNDAISTANVKFDRIDTNKDSILSEEEITNFRKERNKKITMGLYILVCAISIAVIKSQVSKAFDSIYTPSPSSSPSRSLTSAASSVSKMSRADFVDWWHRNNTVYPSHCQCPKDFHEYITDLYDDYLSGRFRI